MFIIGDKVKIASYMLKKIIEKEYDHLTGEEIFVIGDINKGQSYVNGELVLNKDYVLVKDNTLIQANLDEIKAVSEDKSNKLYPHKFEGNFGISISDEKINEWVEEIVDESNDIKMITSGDTLVLQEGNRVFVTKVYEEMVIDDK